MPTATSGRPARPREPASVARWFHPRAFGSANRWWYIGGALSIVVAILTWVFWPQPTPPPPEQPRARQYLDYTACLLTDERGITEPAVAPTWAGLQDASLATHAKVQYLEIAGPQTPANAATYLNNLAQTGCDLIVAVGDLPVATLNDGAKRFPNQAFAAITSRAVAGTIVQISPDNARDAVKTLLTNAVTASGHSPSP
jgi:hypothetical protein